MIYSKKRPYLIPAIILFVIALVLILNLLIKPDLTIRTYTEILPKEKWLLTRGSNGQIISSTIDYKDGYTVEYSLNQFERGEYVALDFAFNKKGRKYVSKGDTILSIISTDVDERLSTALSNLEVAKATMKSLSSGDKEELIHEAQTRLEYNSKQIESQKVLNDRYKIMFEKGLCSQQEYELQKKLLELYEIERGVYQAQLHNLETGVKPEEKNVVDTQINYFESYLDILRGRKNHLVLTSPISGSVGLTFSPDTLLTLINDREVVVHTAVRIEDVNLLKSGQTVGLKISDYTKNYTGEIFGISREVKLLNGEQVVFVSILLDNNDGKLLPGMVKESFVRIRQMTLFEYIFRFLSA